jgi:hypothetical protein
MRWIEQRRHLNRGCLAPTLMPSLLPDRVSFVELIFKMDKPLPAKEPSVKCLIFNICFSTLSVYLIL